MVNKPFSPAVKRAAVELWKANVPLANIRKQLLMSETILRRLLKAVKENQGEMPPHRKPGSGRRERQRETDRERQRDRERDRETERQRQRERDRQTDRQ